MQSRRVEAISGKNKTWQPAATGAFVFALVLAGVSAWAWAERDKDFRCGGLDGKARAQAICMALEANLEFQWLGHAILSPGHRVTPQGALRVFCDLNISQDDVAALQPLFSAWDWRVQNGADYLVRLATGADRHGVPEPENSIFHPANPSYVLKDGCGT